MTQGGTRAYGASARPGNTAPIALHFTFDPGRAAPRSFIFFQPDYNRLDQCAHIYQAARVLIISAEHFISHRHSTGISIKPQLKAHTGPRKIILGCEKLDLSAVK